MKLQTKQVYCTEKRCVWFAALMTRDKPEVRKEKLGVRILLHLPLEVTQPLLESIS